MSQPASTSKTQTGGEGLEMLTIRDVNERAPEGANFTEVTSEGEVAFPSDLLNFNPMTVF